MPSSAEDQLVSFFIYSLFIYPITNYIVSPSRKYPRWKAALYAITFLVLVATMHLMYENMEEGPNHYQLMGVTRDTPVSLIKKAYRALSLELHPDKNKAVTATEDFQRVKHAFDILIDKDKQREYNRLGDPGVLTSSQTVIDLRYLVMQFMVYYGSSLILAFMMTFSEPTGQAFNLSIFGLAVMLAMETMLVIYEVQLPPWLLPQNTPHEVVSTMHRLFPAFMNGCRCITGAFYMDKRVRRVKALEALSETSRGLNARVSSLIRSTEKLVQTNRKAVNRRKKKILAIGERSAEVVVGGDEVDGSENYGHEARTGSGGNGEDYGHFDEHSDNESSEEGFMARTLAEAARKFAASPEGKDGSVADMIRRKTEILKDPVALRNASNADKGRSKNVEFLICVGVYLLARYLFIKSPSSS